MSNVIKSQAPFERLKSYEASPDISLRKAIITQAIIDATNTSNLREAKKLEMEAKAWIFGGSEYFQELCIEAGIEPSFVIKLAKKIIKLHKSQTKSPKNHQYHVKSKDRSGKNNDISKKLEIII
ncbi:hypothetical protein [Candidatus Trichorickettsia mobilis]|jgi:hypothetical protein|uniref:hypothetical protein n=1 Tax=Candidatus Trichorickettsia mobilis TaxID=1346319 RepID=UPI002930B549|nr:hypothetical protein [Candidatus Trichorickettsia mobilis]